MFCVKWKRYNKTTFKSQSNVCFQIDKIVIQKSFLRKCALDTIDYAMNNIIITTTRFNETLVWSYLSCFDIFWVARLRYILHMHALYAEQVYQYGTYHLIPINVSVLSNWKFTPSWIQDNSHGFSNSSWYSKILLKNGLPWYKGLTSMATYSMYLAIYFWNRCTID